MSTPQKHSIDLFSIILPDGKGRNHVFCVPSARSQTEARVLILSSIMGIPKRCGVPKEEESAALKFLHNKLLKCIGANDLIEFADAHWMVWNEKMLKISPMSEGGAPEKGNNQ